MSADFKTVLTKDPTIADITSDLVYAVKSGASSTTYQSFPSTSSSNSVLIFNIQVPSENIIVARDALITTPLQFRIHITNVAVGDVAVSWGQTAALQAFPLASIMNTANLQINNSSTSVNLQDVLPQLLHLNSNRELFRFNGMTPSLPDQNWGDYRDTLPGANSSPLASYYNQSYDNDQAPRGSHTCKVQIDRYNAAGNYQDHSNISTALTDSWVVTVFTTVTEPIFCSPFIYADPEHNRQGMLGINNMAFTFNINASLNRLMSLAKPAGSVVTIEPGVGLDPDGGKWPANQNIFQNSYNFGVYTAQSPTVLLRLLSSQPSDRLETRNVVPYFDLPRYLTSNANSSTINAFGVGTCTSQSIQLSQLPDYFMIVARKPMSSQTISDASTFYSIRNISINLNNQSGLLSSASQPDLWRLSVKNGSQQTWPEFAGDAFVSNAGGNGGIVPTIGSLFVVSPNDLSLPDYLSSGSLGAFQLQFVAQVYNQFGVATGPVELCVVACNSGIFVNQQGTSNIYTGILTREAVLATKSQEVSHEPERVIGGAMLNRGMARNPRHVGRMASAMRSVGSALSAGSMSAGRSRLSGMF